MNTEFRYLLSFFQNILIEKKESSLNGTLEVRLRNGKLILDSPKANYSFASLHSVFKKAFEKGKIAARNPKHTLILGFGAGSVAHILQKELNLPTEITGVEHDPEIIQMAKKHFELASYRSINLLLTDANDFMQSNQKQFDLLVVDLFRDTDVPKQFTDNAFIDLLAKCCSPGGQIYFNLMIDAAEKRTLPLLLKTQFEKNHLQVHILNTGGSNRVVLAEKIN